MANEILTETHGRVRLITLNRPEAKNSINSALGLALVVRINESYGTIEEDEIMDVVDREDHAE